MRYDYKCTNEVCAHIFELIQRITDTNTQSQCPNCDAVATRQISAPEFILKGEGWPGKTLKRMEEKDRVEQKYQEYLAKEGQTPIPLKKEE